MKKSSRKVDSTLPAEADRRRIALLVVAEDGVDPSAAFLSAAECAPRYYALIREESGPAGDVRGVLPDDVAVIVAPRVEAAISEVVTNCGEEAVLIMNAGERVTSFDNTRGVSRRVRTRDLAAPDCVVWRASLRVPLGDGVIERARWFLGREPAIVTPSLRVGPPPAVTLLRQSDQIGDIFQSLAEAATRVPVPPGGVSTMRFLGAPTMHVVRVFLSGAWRSGFRGFLFASLHGLFWLIVLTRTWLRNEHHTRSAVE